MPLCGERGRKVEAVSVKGGAAAPTQGEVGGCAASEINDAKRMDCMDVQRERYGAVFLRYNLYIVKSSCLKSTIQWLLVHLPTYKTITMTLF